MTKRKGADPVRNPQAIKKSKTQDRRASSEASSTIAPSQSTTPAPVDRRARVEDVPEEDEEEVVEVEAPNRGKKAGKAKARSDNEETPEEELARLQKKWRASVYAFFRSEVIIKTINGRRAHEFHCAGIGCGKAILRYLDTGDSTSTKNLRNHIEVCKCWGDGILAETEGLTAQATRKCIQNIPRAGSITAAFARKDGKAQVTFSTRQLDRTETRAEFVRWVSESKRPFKIAKDRGFVKLMKTGRPHYWIPSPTTISRDTKKVFVRVRQRISKMLRDYPGQLNFATDAWTSPNHRGFVAFTVHLEHEGTPLSFLLDIVEVPKSHTGETLAEEFFKVLQAYAIADKLLFVTTDNASSNDAMLTSLSMLVDNFPGEPNHARCFDHIVHLAAKSLLRPFDVGKAKDADNALDAAEASLRELIEGLDLEEAEMVLQQNEAEDVDEENDVPNLERIPGTFDEMDALSETEREELEEQVVPVKLVLVKLRKLAYAIINSSTILLPAWRELLERLKLSVTNMPRDVRTRWNSTFTMLEYALSHREAVDEFTGSKKELRKFELDGDEWEIVEQLRDILQIFYDATQFFSRDKPSISEVLPAMDDFDEALTTASLDANLNSAVRAAVNLSKKTMNRYYDKTDASEGYRIAMVLDPNHKLTTFEEANWPEDWIETAKGLVREEFDRNYVHLPVSNEDAPEDVAEAATDHQSSQASSRNKFDVARRRRAEARKKTRKTVNDELEKYLATDTEDIRNPVKWWHEQRHVFPRLSRMARDYLTIPATSVAVERVFSKGRILLNHTRNRLSAQSTRALLCVGEWSRLGLVADEDVKAVVEQAEVEDSETEDDVADGWDLIVID